MPIFQAFLMSNFGPFYSRGAVFAQKLTRHETNASCRDQKHSPLKGDVEGDNEHPFNSVFQWPLRKVIALYCVWRVRCLYFWYKKRNFLKHLIWCIYGTNNNQRLFCRVMFRFWADHDYCDREQWSTRRGCMCCKVMSWKSLCVLLFASDCLLWHNGARVV